MCLDQSEDPGRCHCRHAEHSLYRISVDTWKSLFLATLKFPALFPTINFYLAIHRVATTVIVVLLVF